MERNHELTTEHVSAWEDEERRIWLHCDYEQLAPIEVDELRDWLIARTA
jgi:hypothetical protein